MTRSSYPEAKIEAFKAYADYSTTGQFLFVTLSDESTVAKESTKGGNSIGVLMNNPESAKVAEVALVGGGALVVAGESITLNKQITSNTSGQAIHPDAAGQRIMGIALASADSGDIFPVLLVAGETYAAEA